MNIFKVDKIINRLDKMIDNAIDGKVIESSFDETKMSALETKLSQYLAMTQTTRNHLEEEKQRINSLISDISHQTKTPIANIMLYSQLLEESDLSEEDKLCVKALTEQTEKLNFLISSLVKASRLETGIISLTPCNQLVQPILDSVISAVKEKSLQKNISISCCNTSLSAIFDLKWTTEAVLNIVDNAIKYTPVNGFINISVNNYQLFLRIDISDTGIGISEDDIPKVFSRFYRSQLVNDIEGVGIGLYLAREIIRSEGGYIKVSSEIGEGSTFSVFLPMES